MAVEVMSLVFKARFGKPSQKLVMLALANHANEEGKHVYPGVARIMRSTDLCESTVRQTLRELRDCGLLLVVKASTPTAPTEYRIDIELLRKLENREPVSAIDTGPENEGVVNPGPLPATNTGDYQMPEGGVVNPGPKPSLNVINRQLKDKRPEPEISEADPKELWASVDGQLRPEMARGHYAVYVQDARAVAVSGDVLTVEVADANIAGWLRDRLGKRVAGLLTGITGRAMSCEFRARAP